MSIRLVGGIGPVRVSTSGRRHKVSKSKAQATELLKGFTIILIGGFLVIALICHVFMALVHAL